MIILEAELPSGSVVRKSFIDEHDAKLWVYLNSDNVLDYTYWGTDEVPE